MLEGCFIAMSNGLPMKNEKVCQTKELIETAENDSAWEMHCIPKKKERLPLNNKVNILKD